jgi:hypothetical protein
VRDVAREHGFLFVTADRVSDLGFDVPEVTVLSYDWPPATSALVAGGARPGVLTSLEPPIIAWELYFRLRRTSARFPHAFLFRGAADRIASTCTFHPLFYPQVRPKHEPSTRDWGQRRFLVAIHSNKAMVRSFSRWFDKPREVSIKRELASRLYPPIGRDLYLERLRAIDHFADRPDFDLLGQGWERRHPAVSPRLHARAMRAYRGPSSEKLGTVSAYRFALCLENSRFEGYVSEKIFDCFFAGTVPVYFGAPDIERYVPPEAFIDLRRFKSYRELERYLDSVDETTARRYLEAGADFVRSVAFEPFTQEQFAREMVQALCTLPW